MNRKVSDCLQGRENNFDFIRFMAALLVIFHHCYYLYPSAREPLLAFSQGRYTIGGICVAIFFIVSGFLITRSFDRTRDVAEFFTSRALRIYPALIAVVCCTVFIIGPLLTTNSLSDYFTSFSTFKYYYSNTFMVNVQYYLPGVFETNRAAKMVNGSFWTLPYELFCYCLVAAIGLIISRKSRAGFFLLLLTVIVFRNRLLHGGMAILETMFYFLCGALIYIFRRRVILNTTVAAIALSLLIINMRYNTAYVWSLVISGITLSYVVIYLSFVKTTYLKNFAKEGDYSYGLYIWGYPVQQTISLYFKHLNTFTFFLLSAGVTLTLSMLSWHLIEKKALKWKDHFKQSNLQWVYKKVFNRRQRLKSSSI